MKQNEWAAANPHAVVWFEPRMCVKPLCRSFNKRHHHLKDTMRQYQRIVDSAFPFMGFYAMEQRNAVRSEWRRNRNG